MTSVCRQSLSGDYRGIHEECWKFQEERSEREQLSRIVDPRIARAFKPSIWSDTVWNGR